MNLDEIEKRISNIYIIENIFVKSRKQDIVEARALLFWILKIKLGKSFCEIGRCYGYNHATIIHHVNRISSQMKFDKKFNKRIEEIVEKVLE